MQQAFSKQGKLKQHFKTHTVENPFPCNYCPEEFSVGSNLKTHMRTHVVRSYTCAACALKNFLKKVI